MLPSMRYQSSKLAELLHQQKTYQLHLKQLKHITNKQNNQYQDRLRQLNELHSRKRRSYQFSQHQRDRQISFNNRINFVKLVPYLVEDQQQQTTNNQLQKIQEKYNEKINQNPEQPAEKSPKNGSPFKLINHSRSPVNKLTHYQRQRQSERHKKMVINPIVTYRTNKIEKDYEKLKSIKYMMMRYDSCTFHKKTDLYLKDKSSRKSSLFFSQRQKEDLLSQSDLTKRPK